MTDQQYERVHDLSAQAASAFEELSKLEPWQLTKYLQLRDRYRSALQEMIQILDDD